MDMSRQLDGYRTNGTSFVKGSIVKEFTIHNNGTWSMIATNQRTENTLCKFTGYFTERGY